MLKTEQETELWYRSPLYTQGAWTSVEDGYTWIAGCIGDEQIGTLVLNPPTKNNQRVVYQVWVDKRYRRQGLATQLWQLAKHLGLDPIHDTSSKRTKDGVFWARAVGD